ncbi:hypothetical protein HDU85_003055 [Gaertneriomyces sp. JEL0708]|nr:hypothetical protein HDU85_003055 [Gaertneriomyces sp. JEL0708]
MQTTSDLEEAVLRQVEYYFSDENYPNDRYLLEVSEKHSGWVPLNTLMRFSRMKALTSDTQLVARVLSQSLVVEVNPKSKKSVRRRVYPVKVREGEGEGAAKRQRENTPCSDADQRPTKLRRISRSPSPEIVALANEAVHPDWTANPGTQQRDDGYRESIATQNHNHPEAFQSFFQKHFGPDARKNFMQFALPAGLAVPSQSEVPGSNEGYWDSLCDPCRHHWAQQYEYPDMGEHAPQVNGPPFDVPVSDHYNSEEEDVEQPMMHLTPEMIEIFRHSENWRKLRAKEKEEERIREEQKEHERKVAEEQRAQEEHIASKFEAKQTEYGPDGAYQVMSLEADLDEKFTMFVQERKPVPWPIIPIRW